MCVLAFDAMHVRALHARTWVPARIREEETERERERDRFGHRVCCVAMVSVHTELRTEHGARGCANASSASTTASYGGMCGGRVREHFWQVNQAVIAVGVQCAS